ncbi:ATP-binding cassette domain-containing protein [Rickettsia tamurae]
MTQEFIGDKLALLDFSVYKPDTTNFQGEEPITLLNKVTLELLPNKIYKLFAESGKGKTTFLKAITNNWQYTNGEVKFPANAKDNICFIPQHSFIPIGTLVEILTYGIPQKALENDSMTELVIHNTTPLLNNESTIIKTQRFVIDTFINKAKHLLNKVGLLPNIIKEDELESKSINWNERLSGGEKQKIGIIRAILSNSVFIIMDEAATALDVENKRTVYKILKDHVTKLANYTVIYTDHSDIEDFKDAVITINGQNLECEYIA